MSKSFLLLSFLMGVVVLSSNYLVQFPINYYGLNEILTYGAFSYPIAFLITDLANRSYGKRVARKIVYFGFVLGIGFTVLFSTDFADIISIRIAIGSGIAFLTAQLLDVDGFDSSIMPATGTPEPGGLLWDETLNICLLYTSPSPRD